MESLITWVKTNKKKVLIGVVVLVVLVVVFG